MLIATKNFPGTMQLIQWQYVTAMHADHTESHCNVVQHSINLQLDPVVWQTDAPPHQNAN